MSMHVWPISGTGIVLTDSELDKIFECVEDEFDFADENESFNIYDSEDNEGLYFRSYDGKHEYCPNRALVLNSARQPRLFEAAYPGGIEELVAEFKAAFEEAGLTVPESFDWEAHIGYFECTVFG